MKSIREKPGPSSLPDFRSLGVALRVLLGGVALAMLAALVAAPALSGWSDTFVALSLHAAPVLLATLGLCAALAGPLSRRGRWSGPLAVMALAVLTTLAVEAALAAVGLAEGGRDAQQRSALLAATGSGLLIAYFALRARALQPAAAEARLAALTARIRPHFLFNSLNAVLSLIRVEPRRAEAALESLAELFRVLMRDPRDLVSLSEEIALCRQYLELERLRLGERLRVVWEVAEMPADAQMPPLMLQPLLENAVYHGIEPSEEGGEIRIRFARDDSGIVIELENPVAQPAAGERNAQSPGNHMALANIAERLALHYDLDAQMSAGVSGGRFRVRIVLPYRT